MRKRDLLLIAAVYGAAGIAGGAVYLAFAQRGAIIAVGCADLAATLVVFVFSAVFNNSSVYDPYWSVAPLPIAFAYFRVGDGHPTVFNILLSGLILLWAIRLTKNWVDRWNGFRHEDWRYRGFRIRSGRWYWAVSLGGIHLVPTIMVFGATLPLRYAFAKSANATPLTWAALFLVAGAIVLETVADQQMNGFLMKRKDPSELFSEGLWGVCRHPNYLGEIAFWWGIWLFAVSVNADAGWTIIGPLAMTVLFLVVSIPMIERRMASRREGYQEYRASVPVLIPLPRAVHRAFIERFG